RRGRREILTRRAVPRHHRDVDGDVALGLDRDALPGRSIAPASAARQGSRGAPPQEHQTRRDENAPGGADVEVPTDEDGHVLREDDGARSYDAGDFFTVARHPRGRRRTRAAIVAREVRAEGLERPRKESVRLRAGDEA